MLPTSKSDQELLKELFDLLKDNEIIEVHHISVKDNKFIIDKNADTPITRPYDEAKKLKKLFNDLEKKGLIIQRNPTAENGIDLPIIIQRLTD